MTSYRKGDTTIDSVSGYRRIFDGQKWRRLCSIDQCEKRVQMKGLCARHLRESCQSRSNSEYLPIDDCKMIIHQQIDNSSSQTDQMSMLTSPYSLEHRLSTGLIQVIGKRC